MIEYLLAAALHEPVQFMTFNVCKSAGCGNSPAYNVRRNRVSRVITESGADVIAIQEATDWQAHGNKTQWEDIQATVGPYKSPDVTIDPCERNNCEHTARILFNSDTVQQAGPAGSIRLRDIADNLSSGSKDRQVTWAYLSHNGTTFLAVSLHTDNTKTSIGEQDRMTIGQSIKSWAVDNNKKHGLDVPVVVMGDLNSYDARQPNGIQHCLEKDGWVDAYTAPDKRGTHFSTVNYTPDTRQWNGWPPRPRYFNQPATRIDYLFGFNGVEWQQYEVQVKRLPNGDFDPKYQASDHQPVLAAAVLD